MRRFAWMRRSASEMLGPAVGRDQELGRISADRWNPTTSRRVSSSCSRSESNALRDIEMPTAPRNRRSLVEHGRGEAAEVAFELLAVGRDARAGARARSSSHERVRVGDRGRREAFEAGRARSARQRVAWRRARARPCRAPARGRCRRSRGSCPGSFGMPCRPRSRTTRSVVVAQHGEVGALVRARQQVVDDAGEVVAVGLLGDGLAEVRARAGTGRRGGARRRPRRTGWRAGCRRSRRSCRASRATSSARTPSGARASSHVTLSAARAVLSPRCDLVACPPRSLLRLNRSATTRALHQRCTPQLAHAGGARASGADRGTRAA